MANSITTKFYICALPCQTSSCKHFLNSKSLPCVSKVKNTEHFNSRTLKTSSQYFKFKVVTNRVQATISQQWNNLYSQYEEFVGVSDVQKAQDKVKEAEKEFLSARAAERAVMRNLISVRDGLKHVRERISHVDYSNPLYPQLANEQHELVTKEEKMQADLDVVEEKERDTFLELSGAMRDSYEKERARVERTKNWSLIGTVVGAIIGMFGSIYINRVRTQDLKQMILNQSASEGLKETIDKMLPHTQSQYEDIKEEIKQLQVALINKLLQPPGGKQREDTSHNSPHFISSESKEIHSETLESVIKVLRSFEAQLKHLSDKTTNNQTDQLLEAIVDMKAQLREYVDAEQLGRIDYKLDELKAILSGEPNDLEPRTSNITSKHQANNSDTYIKHFAIFTAVLGAVYYIITV